MSVLRAERELVEVDAEVDPVLELAEVHRRVIAAGGPALLFKRVKGSPFPVVTNLFGTRRRVELAFGDRASAFVREAAALPHELMPPSFGKLWAQRDLAWQGLSLGMTQASAGPVTEVAGDPKLGSLPLLHCWKDDGGSFVTLAKGNRSAQVRRACQTHGGFYLGSIGGPAAILAQDAIKHVEVLEYPELGMEAIWRIEVEDFPAFIITDDKGNDFFADLL